MALGTSGLPTSSVGVEITWAKSGGGTGDRVLRGQSKIDTEQKIRERTGAVWPAAGEHGYWRDMTAGQIYLIDVVARGQITCSGLGADARDSL